MNEPYAFTFVLALAGVINGLGIVRWLNGVAEFLRRKQTVEIRGFWTYYLFAGFHFLAHILLWWSLWGIKDASLFNFLNYLYVLAGPILLFLGTSLMIPQFDEKLVNLEKLYFEVRRPYWTVLILLWLWAIFLWPLLRGVFAPTAAIFAINLQIGIVLRITNNSKIHFASAVLSWVILVLFIALYAMKLGTVAEMIDQ